MNKLIISSLVMANLLIAGCKKDNYDNPASTLTGRVIYNKEALGVRSNGVQLELWQHGYELFTKIAVYISPDGSFSASLFDGSYKLVLRQGNGPWLDNADSLDVTVRGTTNVDVSVQPYFIVTNATFTKGTANVSAVVNVTAVNTSLPLESVSLYLSKTNIVDQVNNIASATVVPDISQPVNLSVNIPAGATALFARVGVKTSGVAEQIYSQTEKLQ
jgi:hypothetical protein